MKFIGRTHVGLVRKNNEDAYGYSEEIGIAVLADGMGGLAAGEVASQTAVAAVLEYLQVASIGLGLVTDGFELANTRVREDAVAGNRLGQMGTTLVVWALAGPGRCIIGHVGDSRAYRYRDGQLLRLTKDHSVVQQMVDEGVMTAAEAQVSSNRNLITRAVGLEPTVLADVVELGILPGDSFLLCSDGLTDLLTDAEMLELFTGADLATVADSLISAALAAGGTDNVTVLLIVP